jgi:hypothetical protein
LSESTETPRALAFLGPQRFRPTLKEAVASLGITGDLATVTAGWQERETEVEELHEHLGGRAVNLELHARADRVFAADPELATAHHARQALFREMQAVYSLRLDKAIEALVALETREGHPRLLAEERASALEAVRTLDRAHAARVGEIHAEFAARWRPAERTAVAEERVQIARLVDRCEALAIAGGHVLVLANRLRLFDVLALSGARPVLAWSGGAMACAEEVVAFGDHPPHGSGHPQWLDQGLGLIEDMTFFPHARRRLDLADTVRQSRLARRLRPARAVVLDDGAILSWQLGHGWAATDDVLAIDDDGGLTPLARELAAPGTR